MPLIEPHLDDAANPVDPPSPRSALFFDGTNWRVARVSATGYLEIDVLSTVMDAAAATAANQALILAQLQLIEDMRNALQSVANDRLIVRGEDQLFSYHGQYKESIPEPASPGGIRTLSGSLVPAGEIWVVTDISASDITSAITYIRLFIQFGVTTYRLRHIAPVAQYIPCVLSGHLYLEEDDHIRASFGGVVAGDTILLTVNGYKMTLES